MRRACGTIIWQAVACALLLACTHTCNAIEHLAPGICPTIDVRNTPEQLNKLRGCRVIEGQLSIVLMERATAKSFENMSFPELREVTGHIKIYRLKGLRNLGDLFPNLSVVRGMQLFRDYSIVIFDNESLESLGLRSLWKVERGAVRIEHNDKLCYTNTIDWTRITPPNAENIIRSNYDVRLCGLCPNSTSRVELRRMTAMQCPADTTGRLLCWDEKNCQRVCPSDCGDLSCTANGTCCHPECLGGCDGPSRRDCHVCRHFSFGYGEQRECIEKCPHGTYELYSRCVTEQECRSLPPPPADNSPETSSQPGPNLRYYKIYNRTCTYVCPSGFMETGNRYDATCGPCPESGCSRQCAGGSITTIASADQFRGCTKIQGTLEISMRAIGVNTMSVLESALGEIREIEGALKVIRSYPLVSLTFFKKLKKIGTNPSPESSSRYHSLHIFDNPNLELLWDWETHGPIEIQSGWVYIHFNPRLCYHHIMPLRKMVRDSSGFNEREISEDNGDQSSCFQTKLDLKVSQLHQRAAVLTWNMFCLDDPRKLLGYSLNYIIAEQNVTIYGQRDACSDTWSVRDISMDEVRNHSAELKQSREPCSELQPHFYPLTDLVPYTRYAAYVRTYTTSQNKVGAQSPIVYFTTLPGRPSPPTSLAVDLRSPHSVYIKWGPPSMPNGTILSYHVEIEANLYNRQKILASNINYCTNPTALPNMIAVRNEDVSDKQEEKSTGDVKNGSCACKQELKPMRFTTRAEAERAESIDFENDLQNHVYIKSDRSKSNNTINRTRRSIDNGLNSMLVLLSDYHSPRFGQSYVNKTDQGYVESAFYELDGNRTGVRVLNLRHFSWYTVNVWACRQKHAKEEAPYYEAAWCSERTSFVFRTLELFNADVVGNVQAEILPSNKTVPEMNVTWEPPKNPNGFVVGYNVHHSRIEDHGQAQDVGMQSCISADEFEANGRSYTTRVLAAGNYSVRVTPITLSGAGNVSADVYIFIPERTASSGVEWVWGVVGGCVAVAALVGGGAWYARRGLLPAHDGNKLFASVNPEYVSTVYVPDEWEVPRASIEFIRELGQGSFGMVYEGLAKGLEKNKPETRCAVKTVNEHATDRERIEFLNEASVMKAFDTWHVVRLLGVVSRGQPTLVVMELMEQGDLKTYLRSHRPDADSSLPAKQPPNPPTLQNILQMAIEIADGMAYLSAKKFVHRDLAARNCMVAGDLTVKVGDFGMTRDIYETDYYRKGSKGLLPVRWMSPESLKDGVFSSNSDAWSYGVVLWEMATLAMQPYQGLSNEQVLRYVVEGGVMERPEHCPDRLYELMRACWSHRPVARPSFLQLVADLAPSASSAFRHRSFFHTPQGQELYSLQRTTTVDEDQEMAEVSVGAVATGSGSNLFGVSGRLASWVRELSSLRSRASDDAAAEPLAPAADGVGAVALKPVGGPNGTLRFDPAATGC